MELLLSDKNDIKQNTLDFREVQEKLQMPSVCLYSWGKNKYGELGLGHASDICEPSQILNLQGQNIIQLSSGGKHTAALVGNGQLYICGTDVLGLLGHENENRKWKEQHRFQIMSSLDTEDFIQVACAEFHSLGLTKEGFIYAWGGNLHNKLGQPHQLSIPAKIFSLTNRKIVQIACGDHHSCALSENGEVFTWGGGGRYNGGQCGHGHLKEIDSPRLVEFFKEKSPIQIVCGGYHTMVLCEDSILYGFGKGTYGQCGYGISEDTSVPKQVKFSSKYEQFENKNIKREDFLQSTFLLSNFEENLNITTRKRSPIVIRDVKCGGEHTIVLSSFGRVYTFGHGYTGQLGLGDNQNYDRPIIVKRLIGKTVTQIAAGWSHSLILTSEGNLYGTGCGKYGELGMGDYENRRSFTLIQSASMLNITNVYAGGHHSWIICDSISLRKLDNKIPSPLCSNNFSPRGSRSPEREATILIEQKSPSREKLSGHSQFGPHEKKKPRKKRFKFNLELLVGESPVIQQNESINLLVAYTELNQSHRYVRFAISPNSRYKNLTYKELSIMVSTFIKKDPGIISYKLQDDNCILSGPLSNFPNNIFDQVFSEIKNMKFYERGSFQGSYSLSMIYDLTYELKMLKTMKSNKYVTNSLEKRIYPVRNITDCDIEKNETEKLLSHWVLDFYSYFEELFKGDIQYLQLPRFIELRPICFNYF